MPGGRSTPSTSARWSPTRAPRFRRGTRAPVRSAAGSMPRRSSRSASMPSAPGSTKFIAVGFSKLVVVPVEPVGSWSQELDELADAVLALQRV